MPFLDRHWWVRVPIALVPLCAVALIVAYVLRYPSQSLSDPLLGAGCTGVGTLMVLAFAYFLLQSIGPARHRAEQRLAAITGNRDALPLAPEAAAQPGTDLPKVPFTIEFALTGWDQPKLARLRVVMSAPLFVLVLVLTFLLDSQNHYSNVPVALAYVALYVVGGALHLWREIVVRPYIRMYHTPRRIFADTMGIHWQPIVGHERAIRWDKMRLLEVMSFNATPFTSNQHVERRRYTLLTENSAIWWIDPGNLYLPPSGSYAQLLALIKARTSLEPRTFDSEDLFATTLLREAVEPPVAAPPLASDVTYLLAFPLPTRRGRVITGFVGIVVTMLAILAGIWILSLFGIFVLPPFLHITTSGLFIFAVIFLLIGSFAGPWMLIWALRATPTRSLRRRGGIRADSTGISDYPLRRGASIAWSDIVDIQCETLDEAKAYIVRSAVDDAKITWPDIPGDRYPPAALVTALGFTPISPDELVALAMQMTGKPLTSRGPQPSITGAAYAVS